MTAKIKQAFPRMLLAFGLVSILMVSIPGGVASQWGTGVVDQIKKTPGEPVGLNPQPLPPDPPPDKLGGKVQITDETKLKNVSVGQKEKLKATPRSQVGKVLQDTGAGKLKNQRPQPHRICWQTPAGPRCILVKR